MRRPIFFVLIALLSLNCKKSIETLQEDLVIKAMTDGKWIVTSYIKGSDNLTDDFNGYLFQFKKNKTVDAVKSGITEATGTWNGDADTRTMFANFPNVNNPLMLLNGTWNITNNSWTFVEATQTINTEVRSIRLDKN